MPTCPNGHQSGSDDWCEVCGHRMAGPGAAAGAVPPPPPPPPPAYGYPGPTDGPPGPAGDPHATAQAELCPQCRTPREAMAPFCEECRYNFLTQTATSYTPISPPPQPGLNLPPGFQAQPGPPPGPPRDPFDYQGSRPSQMNRPAEPLSHDPSQGPGHGPGPAPGQGPGPMQGPGPDQGPGPSPFPNPDQGPGPSPFPNPDQGPGPSPFPNPGQGAAPGPFPGPGGQQPPQGFPPPVPSAFQQGGPPAPPAYPQPSPPAPPQHTGGDDWMLSPPSRTQSPPPPAGPQGPQSPQAPQGPQSPSPFGQQPPPGQHQGPPPHQAPPQGGPHGAPQGQQPPHFPSQAQGPVGWTAVIAPDRDYFMAMMQRSGPEATGLNLPAYSPEHRLPLSGNQVSIGRRRHSTGESPDIDLSVPPEDPGVSHQHAVLVQQPDGSWAVVDQNSTNGTTLNGAEDPIQPYVPIPLQDGDRVHVGAWTTITVRRG
ncbi:FHA domain-containing protein [Streptomyces zhihengii]